MIKQRKIISSLIFATLFVSICCMFVSCGDSTDRAIEQSIVQLKPSEPEDTGFVPGKLTAISTWQSECNSLGEYYEASIGDDGVITVYLNIDGERYNYWIGTCDIDAFNSMSPWISERYNIEEMQNGSDALQFGYDENGMLCFNYFNDDGEEITIRMMHVADSNL